MSGKQLSFAVAMLLVFTCASSDAIAESGKSAQYRITTTRLGTPPSLSVNVEAINKRKTVVGRAFSTTSERTVPFLWTPDEGFVIFLGEIEGVATSINNRNVVVGHVFRGEQISGFLWSERGGFVDLGSFLPADINDRGQIAGVCSDDNGLALGGCLWERGVVTRVNRGDSCSDQRAWGDRRTDREQGLRVVEAHGHPRASRPWCHNRGRYQRPR